MVLEGVVDQFVSNSHRARGSTATTAMPSATARFDRGGGRFLDEDGRGHPRPHLLLDPAHRLGVRHAEQEEQVRRTGADRQAEPDVVGVDQRHRTHRHVQAAGRLDQRHHRAVQRQQQLTESQPDRLHAIALSFVRFDYRCDEGVVRSAIG